MQTPEKLNTDSGNVRNVGFEIEFSGIEPERCIQLLHDKIGGTVINESPFSQKLDDTRYGTFIVELDAALLSDGKYKGYLETLGIQLDEIDSKESLEDILKDVASTVVPCEVIMPPIPATEIAVADEIVTLLRNEKAKGTGSSILYAFGLHINVELASQVPDYILNTIRAYSLLYDWICVKTSVDYSRRLTPYIKRYPDEYLEYIFRKDYQPDINTLINDYLHYIPSRNHALDMLPAFADIDKEQVISQATEPDLIKPRPAFHYRLANCRIDEPDWSIAEEWYYWLAIEKLADDKEKLNQLMSAWVKDSSETILPKIESDWVEKIDSIINQF